MADDGWGVSGWDDTPPQRKTETKDKTEQSRSHIAAVKYEISPKFEYRRAFSESKLLDALGAPGFYFENGKSYNFITAGNIDSLSFLKAVLRQQRLEYCLASTWCIGADDILQFREWIEEERIKRLDFYVGEIFRGTYNHEYEMLRKLYADYPELGRVAIFRNHSKIFAGYGERFYFGIQSSANINTNPRTENACITIDKGIYQFYRDYFDGIKSFEKEEI